MSILELFLQLVHFLGMLCFPLALLRIELFQFILALRVYQIGPQSLHLLFLPILMLFGESFKFLHCVNLQLLLSVRAEAEDGAEDQLTQAARQISQLPTALS